MENTHASTINISSSHSKVFRHRFNSAVSFLYVLTFIVDMVLYLYWSGTGRTVPAKGQLIDRVCLACLIHRPGDGSGTRR